MKKLFSKLKNPKALRTVVVVVVVLLFVGGIFLYEKLQGRVFIDDSLIQGPIISVAPSASGTLSELDAQEGEIVKKGDLLAIVGTQALRADTYGLVTSAQNVIGSSITAQTPVVQMVNLSDMRVVGTIDENKGLDQIKVGQVVSFTVDALPGRTFWGYVDEVAPSAKQTALSFSISSERPTQQFEIYARYNVDEYPEIKDGMSAKMVVYTNTVQ